MPTLTRRHALAALGTTAVAAPLAGALAAPAAAHGDRDHGRVILIDIDGFDPRFLDGKYADVHPLPRIRQLRRSGAAGTASGTFSSYSNSSRTSTATGTYPDVHRNAGYYTDPTGLVVSQERYIEPDVETIAQALQRQDRTGAYVQWYAVQNYGASYGDLEQLYTQPGGWMTARVDDAIAMLSGQPVSSGGSEVTLPRIPDFLAVYGSEIDGYLHSNGFAGEGLVETLEETDTQIGRLLDAVEELGLAGSTTIMLTGDHAQREWTIPLLPALTAALEENGATLSVGGAGASLDLDADILLATAPRTADITFRTPLGRREIDRLTRRIERIEGVAAVYGERELRRLRAADKLGDLVVEPHEPYHFSTLQDGKLRGSHGGVEEMEIPLIIGGAGVRRGGRLHRPSLTDIAPTVCRLLGVRPPADADGRYLAEAFRR